MKKEVHVARKGVIILLGKRDYMKQAHGEFQYDQQKMSKHQKRSNKT